LGAAVLRCLEDRFFKRRLSVYELRNILKLY
jgi:hypothetical protein